MKNNDGIYSRPSYFTGEICVRIVLIFVYLGSESLEPFRRKIQAEEIWLYKNPRTSSYVTTTLLMSLATFVPLLAFVTMAFIDRYRANVTQGVLGVTLSLGLTGALTNLVKITVGRPRPDFFWRCFPDGKINEEMQCTGLSSVVRNGLKSFPSGHSSVAFATLGFTSFYVAGKLRCFNDYGRGQSWRLCLSMVPMIMATIVALSRTCDYHHHWQDVLVGSLLGLTMAHLCYRQYFPCLSSVNCHRAYDPLKPHCSVGDELTMVKSV